MTLAQATQPVTAEQWSDVKMALAGLAVLVIGALGVGIVLLIQKGAAAAAAMLEARAARALAEIAIRDAVDAKADGKANTQNITALASQMPPTGTGNGVSGTGPGGTIPSLLLPLLLLISLAGCATSEGYKRVVSKTYPVIATRMERYELEDEEAAAVVELRTVSADRKTVRYEDARPAWEAVAPSYRTRIGGDEGLPAQRREDWLKTADILDRAQRAELRYRQTLGTSPQP